MYRYFKFILLLAFISLVLFPFFQSCEDVQSQESPRPLELRSQSDFSDTVNITARYALPTLRLRDDVGSWYYQMFAGDLILKPEFQNNRAKLLLKDHMGSIVGSYNPNTGLLVYHNFITVDPINRTITVEGKTIYRAGQWMLPVILFNKK